MPTGKEHSVMSRLTPEQIVEQTKKYTMFTWAAQGSANPMVMERAEGPYLWDAAGNRYLDLNASLVNVNLGYGHPKLIAAIQEQVGKLAFASPGYATEARANAGRLVSEVAPMKDARVLFTLGGAESNEYAVRFARQFTGRHKILARYRSYHGGTALTVGLTGEPRRWANEPAASGIVHFMDPFCYRCPFGQKPESCDMECAKHLEQVVELEGPKTIAAIIMEPVTGSTGLIIPPKDYLQRLRALCDKHGILFIADEIMSGFGRTGEWFAVNHWGVEPDLISMSKGLTCAYIPFGAVGVSGRVASYFDDHTFSGGLTANSHPVGCAAAAATIGIYREERIIERAREMGVVLERELNRLKDRHPSVGEVRQIGMFSVLDLVKDRKTREPLVPYPSATELTGVMSAISKFLKEHQVITLLRWNYLYVNPTLTITEAQLREGLAVVDSALEIADRAVAGA
jgi:taurine---2-oxoglutarate transaminase